MSTPVADDALQVLTDADDLAAALLADAAAGLSFRPLTLAPTWLYDDIGSDLFDQITRLPEYYPTRRERHILRTRASDIAAAAVSDTLIELGAGTAEKTRVLLPDLLARGLRRYVPVDVAAPTLIRAAKNVRLAHPDLNVTPVVADFHRIDAFPRDATVTYAVLGGTIGNLTREQRRRFLASLAAASGPGDRIIIGVDLVKDLRRLLRAYDDAAGVTAAFNLNVLTRLNRELDADFDIDAFTHRAVWDDEHEWIEMRLRAGRSQRVHIARLGLTLEISRGEEIRTEISAKFRPTGVERELDEAGYNLAGWFTDPDGDFAVAVGALR